MSDVADEKSPLDQALDLFVFAPLGLVMHARENLPNLISQGRQQFQQQTTMAKMVGQFAVTMGKSEIEKRLTAVASPPKPAPAPTPGPRPPVSAPPTPAAAPTQPAEVLAVPTSDELGIPGYDSLAASQVVSRLAGLDPDELELVKLYEAANRGRKTILSRVAQLQG